MKRPHSCAQVCMSSVCLSVCPSVRLFVCPSVRLSVAYDLCDCFFSTGWYIWDLGWFFVARAFTIHSTLAIRSCIQKNEKVVCGKRCNGFLQNNFPTGSFYRLSYFDKCVYFLHDRFPWLDWNPKREAVSLKIQIIILGQQLNCTARHLK